MIPPNMENIKLKIGMPSGSLASPQRGGNLGKLLEDAGFVTSGYVDGGPTGFKTVNFLYGWDGRPQEFGSQLGIEELDVAISGDDWIKERIVEFDLEYNLPIGLEKVLPLHRGRVKLVGIIDDRNPADTPEDFLRALCREKRRITLVSELPYTALDWVKTKLSLIGLADRYAAFSVQKYKTPAKIEAGILIYETWGKTESKVKNGGADLGMEITQSGGTIKNYGLKIIDTVMESEAGIWINPAIKKDAQKMELLHMFVLNLFGAVNAENKVLIVFNVMNSDAGKVQKYLADNNLFADEPTQIAGRDYTQFSIQVDTADKNLPVARIRYELAKLNAKSIDTIPLISSIPSTEILRF